MRMITRVHDNTMLGSHMIETENNIKSSVMQALKEVCDGAMDSIDGLKWITHFANYDYFPGSLSVVCVFDKNSDLASARTLNKDGLLQDLIERKLESIGFKIRDIRQHVSFDTEENCTKENGGNWFERFH